MTSQLIPFQFETSAIRVVVMNDQPMFGARDVAIALAYANPSQAYQLHCKSLKLLSYIDCRELNWDNPNPRGEYVMPESDVYRLIVKSEKPEAERFEKWVFEEVLPSIRKTGSYTLPKARSAPDHLTLKHRQAKVIAATWLSMAKLFGTDEPMARAIAADQVRQHTGLDPTPLLAGNTVQEAPMTPTELGRIIDVSARKVNALLALQGFQEKHTTTTDWVPTDKGKPYCTCNPYKSPNSPHTGYRTLWYRAILDALDFAPREAENVA